MNLFWIHFFIVNYKITGKSSTNLKPPTFRHHSKELNNDALVIAWLEAEVTVLHYALLDI